jgi:hypothetical protein
MRKALRWFSIAIAILLPAIGLLIGVYCALTYEPPFYRERVAMGGKHRQAEADRFVAQSLQLRNDIANEEQWEAVFTDDEVNAWLVRELVAHFGDRVPQGVDDPVVAFNLDQVTLAFKVDRGPFRTLVWVVARARVAADHTVALRLEKIRAGAMPIAADELVEPITTQAKALGLNIEWQEEEGQPVAFIGYSPNPGRVDVVLDRVQLLDGQIYISGRSKRANGPVVGLSLPSRQVLRSTFPRNRSTQRVSDSPPAS